MEPGHDRPNRGRGRSKQQQRRQQQQQQAEGQAGPSGAPAPAAPTPAAPASRSSSSVQSTSASSSSAPASIGRANTRARGATTTQAVTQQMQGLSVQQSAGSAVAARPGGSGNGNGSNGSGSNGNGNGNGSDGRAVGRYNVRGGMTLSEEIQLFHSRPASVSASKKGTSGQSTKIQANLFKLQVDPKWTLNKYHVDFNPPEDRTRMRKIFIREHRERLGMYIFDGSTIFSSHNLTKPKGSIELVSQRQSDNETIKITIKHVGDVAPGDYQRLQVFNIIIRDCLSKLNLQLIKRNYFDKNASVTIREHNLELWPGYITAMGQYEYDIMLQAEIVYKVLRKDTAYDLFRELVRSAGDRGFKEAFTNAVIGSTVMTTYNDKTYRVDDVSFQDTPESTFKQRTRDGERHISYKEYFQQKYQAKINDPRQPMLIHKSSARDKRAGLPELIYLVPELCVMTGLNENMRSNYTLMRAVAEHTAVGPADRMRRLTAFQQRLTRVPEVADKLKQWGIALSPNLAEVDGRILPQETITVGQRKQFQSGPDVDWTRNLRSSPLLDGAVLKEWVVLFPAKLSQEAKDLARMIADCGRGMAFQVPQPKPLSIHNDGAAAFVQGIEDAVNRFNPQMIVCVVPNNRSDRYAAIKKKSIIDRGVPTQVVLAKNIKAKSAMSIATKITIQINCKIGGVPWGVDIPLKKAMIIGFDVCHDSRDKRKSFGAMVASIDSTFGRFFSTIGYHEAGVELSNSISANVIKAVHRYQQINGHYPSHIIVFRDGVGDGDFQNVHDIEVEKIREACEPLYPPGEFKFGFVIVTKRINTRLFNSGRNPPPGTIVDDVVTNPNRFDFFLVSQSVRQGTVSPTHYNVIADTTKLQVDHYQRLTYKLTHMYFNWSGTVRVPAPCQYAHKLAFLTNQSLGQSHCQMDQLLYFL